MINFVNMKQDVDIIFTHMHFHYLKAVEISISVCTVLE